MADIDQIIAGGAGAGSTADFSKLGTLFDSYYKARDEAYKQEGRDIFKGGIPRAADGSIDYGAMRNALFQHGDVGQGIAVDNLDLARQQLKFGQDQSTNINNTERGGPPIVSPPSSNRNASAIVAPPLNRGGTTSQAANAPHQQNQPATVMTILAAQGIPNDQLGAASAAVARQLGIDDLTQPIDLNNPQVRNVIVPAIAQLKRSGIGQVVPDTQPGQPQPQQAPPQQPPQIAQAPQQPPQAPPQAPQAPQTATPMTNQVTSTAASPEPSRAEKLIAMYSGIMSNPMSPKQNVELAKARLESLQKNTELTPELKGYAQGVAQGFKGTFQDWQADVESRKTGATEEAKIGAQKYQSLVENGTKAQMEIPQLELLKEQMNDPNFFSGAGEKYNLLYKRLKSAVGIDPEAAVPQEYLRKATAANVLSSLGALKGLGQIRVAEINMAREAAASPENSIPANKLLVEISKRTHERNAQIAEMAQDYKEKNGVLDPGFDKKVTAFYKQNPLFTDGEIKDWHKVIGEAPKSTTAAAQPPMNGAKQAPDGNWYVPDPNRQGKYLKVVQ